MARTVKPQATEQFIDLHFPLAGIDLSTPLSKQAPRKDGSGQYARTTPDGLNVRGFDSLDRSRGGSRRGHKRYVGQVVVAGWIIQELNVLVGTGYNPPGGVVVQLSNSGRVVTLLAVSQGNVYVRSPGETAWTTPTNNTGDTPPLNLDGLMQSTALDGKLYFADGVNRVFYDPITVSLETWTANAGALPVDADGAYPRLNCTWRGRLVEAGLEGDPQAWFMSAVDDATDWDYSPLSRTATQAIAGSLAPQGLAGDVIVSLCPYSDDVLIFFCDHHIYMMRGDPLAGGQIDLVSDVIGGVFGTCWAKDPYGNVFFVSNNMGVYMMTPGNQPQRISQQVERLFKDINTGDNGIRLAWDDSEQSLKIFVTPLDEPAVTTHFTWEARNNAWWRDTFKNENHNPLCCVTLDGNEPDDRVLLLGSWDGWVRASDRTATDDDGSPIESSVLLGPILTVELDEMLVKDLQAVLGEDSGDVTWAVYAGRTAEAALAAEPVASGTWTGSRNFTNSVRQAGNAVYVSVSSKNPWAMETIRARIDGQGKVRRRN